MSNRKLVGYSILILILTTGAAMAELFGKSSLSPEWAERFKDLSKLNAYAANQPVHLSNVTLTGWDISGAKLPGARFDDTEWKDVKLERGVLNNVTFKKSKLQGVEFDRGVLIDVTFEDTELRSTSFYKAKLQRVRFIRCKFNGVNVDETVESTIEITDSKLLSSSLSEGQLIATVKNSTLKDVEFTDLESPSSLTFEKSELKEVNFERSILERFVLNYVKADIGGTGGGRINVVEIRNSQFGLSFSETLIDSFIVSTSTIETAMNSATIKSLDLTDCEGMKGMTLYMTKLGRIRIQNCGLNDFALVKATVDEFSVSNAKLTKNQFMNSKIKTMTLENVSLDGKIDFTNSQIDQLTAKNITKLPGLNLITTGSNVKLD